MDLCQRKSVLRSFVIDGEAVAEAVAIQMPRMNAARSGAVDVNLTVDGTSKLAAATTAAVDA